MNNININEDLKDRGLEFLLYKKEKDVKNNNENKNFKFYISLPFLFRWTLNFKFDICIIKKHKPPEG